MTDPKRSDRKTAAQTGRRAQERRDLNRRAAGEAVRGRQRAAAKSTARSEKVIQERAKLAPLERRYAGPGASDKKQAVPSTRVPGFNQDPQSTNTMSADRLLSIYLNDHLAGSTIGVGLARRTSAKNRGTPLGDYLERLTSEIESDREILERLMNELGVRRNRLKAFAAWMAEKSGRVKLNGQLKGYSPLSRFLELEHLYLGITGKRELWRALQCTLGNDERFDFKELGRRAERQAAEVEEHRLEAARMALSPSIK